MFSQIHRVAAYALIALGAIHATFARCYGEFSTEAIWFTGAGLAFVFLGLFNVAALSAPVPRVWLLCRIANLIVRRSRCCRSGRAARVFRPDSHRGPGRFLLCFQTGSICRQCVSRRGALGGGRAVRFVRNCYRRATRRVHYRSPSLVPDRDVGHPRAGFRLGSMDGRDIPLARRDAAVKLAHQELARASVGLRDRSGRGGGGGRGVSL
jgi:hypothetical protein